MEKIILLLGGAAFWGTIVGICWKLITDDANLWLVGLSSGAAGLIWWWLINNLLKD